MENWPENLAAGAPTALKAVVVAAAIVNLRMVGANEEEEEWLSRVARRDRERGRECNGGRRIVLATCMRFIYIIYLTILFHFHQLVMFSFVHFSPLT